MWGQYGHTCTWLVFIDHHMNCVHTYTAYNVRVILADKSMTKLQLAMEYIPSASASCGLFLACASTLIPRPGIQFKN